MIPIAFNAHAADAKKLPDSGARVSADRCEVTRSSGVPFHVRVEESRSQRPTLIRQTFASMVPLGLDLRPTGSPLVPMADSHRLLVDVRREIFFMLPAVVIKPLEEISGP